MAFYTVTDDLNVIFKRVCFETRHDYYGKSSWFVLYDNVDGDYYKNISITDTGEKIVERSMVKFTNSDAAIEWMKRNCEYIFAGAKFKPGKPKKKESKK